MGREGFAWQPLPILRLQREVLDYFISPDNLRPKLLPALLENPSVSRIQLRQGCEVRDARHDRYHAQESARAMSIPAVIAALKSNPYLKKEEAEELGQLVAATTHSAALC